ncbi:MAG: histidine--tRNA ligase [Clostridia bacterium]|nr:histidine--tRNA ligase [Clostridia bacterium]
MISIPKGIKDVTPAQSYKWHYIENILRDVARDYCVNEIRTPTFEHTELFARGVGDTTDIVNKEMYTFEDKGGRSMTLKPEGTAGVARSYIENSLSSCPQPVKMYYMTPVFRYERPQAGRLREHHQFGIEIYGSASPQADIEVISIASAVFKRLGIGNLTLNINSIGCPECRKKYNEALQTYLSSRISDMCNTCKERIAKNPLRILDCKEPKCKEITLGAPVILDYLCDECKSHHGAVCDGLKALGIDYKVNPNIVRGLDYYTRTVFEFVSDNIGAQGTVCGGGRYDNLVAQVGGKPTPAVGFGMGIERLMLTMESIGASVGNPYAPKACIVDMGGDTRAAAVALAEELRSNNIAAERDISDRSVKAQLKYASKIEAKYALIIGEDELKSGLVTVKTMSTGESNSVARDAIVKFIKEAEL